MTLAITRVCAFSTLSREIGLSRFRDKSNVSVMWLALLLPQLGVMVSGSEGKNRNVRISWFLHLHRLRLQSNDILRRGRMEFARQGWRLARNT